MDGRNVVLLMCLVAAPGQAQQVFKCVQGGTVSYQSAPCSGGEASRTWDAVPEPERSPQERQRLAAIEQELARRNRPAAPPDPSLRIARPARSAGSSQCEAAKAQREAAYRTVGLRRSFKFSSEWDKRVQQACR